MTSTKRPAPPQDRPFPNLTNAVHVTAYRRQDGYQAPTVEDRAIAAAIAVLEQHGYGIAMRCLDCGHGIFSKSSLARLRGPKCAARAEAVAR